MLKRTFVFRPWVRRAGLSIVIVAAVVTLVISIALSVDSEARYGWMGERPVWVYLATLWAGGLRVWLGTMRPAGEVDDEQLVLRPLHQFTTRRHRPFRAAVCGRDLPDAGSECSSLD